MNVLKRSAEMIIDAIVNNVFVWNTLNTLAQTIIDALAMKRARVEQKVLDAIGISEQQISVIDGPFPGLLYPFQKSYGSEFLPKILGTYEKEIVPALEEALARSPQTVIDIGAAEGYYAVGIALRLASAHIYAYDVSAEARGLLKEMAVLNGVEDRISIECDFRVDDFSSYDHVDNVLLICDCEGYEDILFQDVQSKDMMNYAILVELHEFATAGVGDRIAKRFSKTHHITKFDAVGRRISDFPLQGRFTTFEKNMALWEARRKNMYWYHIVPRSWIQK